MPISIYTIFLYKTKKKKKKKDFLKFLYKFKKKKDRNREKWIFYKILNLKNYLKRKKNFYFFGIYFKYYFFFFFFNKKSFAFLFPFFNGCENDLRRERCLDFYDKKWSKSWVPCIFLLVYIIYYIAFTRNNGFFDNLWIVRWMGIELGRFFIGIDFIRCTYVWVDSFY
jgi:hypothetical protein